MKKIIRYLARVSGVEAEIVRKNTKDIAGKINDLSTFMNDEPRVKKMLEIMAFRAKEFGHFGEHFYLRIIFKQNFPEPENPTK